MREINSEHELSIYRKLDKIKTKVRGEGLIATGAAAFGKIHSLQSLIDIFDKYAIEVGLRKIFLPASKIEIIQDGNGNLVPKVSCKVVLFHAEDDKTPGLEFSLETIGGAADPSFALGKSITYLHRYWLNSVLTVADKRLDPENPETALAAHRDKVKKLFDRNPQSKEGFEKAYKTKYNKELDIEKLTLEQMQKILA